MKNLILLLCVFVYGQISVGQHDSTRISGEETSSNIKLAYNSSLVYPGIRAGIEIPLAHKVLTKAKRTGKEKQIFKDRFITANAGWYRHPDFHDNLYITAGYLRRRTNSSGFFTEFSPEIGYSRTFLGGTTYRIDDNGNVFTKKSAGYNYALISLGAGLGYDFSVARPTPIAAYCKLNLLTMFPYNSTIYIRPALELGVIYKPGKFLVFNATNKRIKK